MPSTRSDLGPLIELNANHLERLTSMMSHHTVVVFRTVLLSGCLTLLPISPSLAAGSFAGFAGRWHGSGTITMTDGGREKIRCKGTYAVRSDNQALTIDLLCASDSYKVNIVSDVTVQGEGFAGQWQETSRQVRGNVTGSFPGPGQLQANLEGTGFGMQFSARTAGSRQTVSLQAEGIEVHDVAITLSR